MIYHITSRANWANAQASGLFRAPSLATWAFIHCSSIDQIIPVANSMYRDKRNLLVLCIDESEVSSRTIWEPPAHSNTSSKVPTADNALFPHVYGPIEVAAVAKVVGFAEGDSGFELPADLQE